MDTAAPAVASKTTPSVSYISAVWLGMPPEDIARGIADGIIAPPPGWTQPATAGSDAGQDVDVPVAATTASAGTDAPVTLVDAGEKPAGKPLPVDRDRVLGLFEKLDPAFDSDSFDAIWTRAGATDAERSASLVGWLARALLGRDALPSSAAASPGDLVSARVAGLESFLADADPRAQLADLGGKSGDELAALAKTDAGYRYALMNLDSMAILGNAAVDAANNARGELDRFDPNSGEQNISDAYLEDRAKLLAWKLSVDAGGATTLEGDQSWTFTDRRNASADGTPYELQLQAADAGGTTNTVVFGADSASGEILKGGSGTDRIYGGSGDDVLRGNAGGDHLEGGRGDDLVLGGAGSDDLSGDQGADELDGGTATDRLRGGAGDDVLTGGRGDDRLEGGAGHDVYVVDPGDGNDTIVDADGDGELQVEGQALTGATQNNGGTWRSADGRARYSFAGDAAGGGTLTLSYYGTGDAAADAAPEAVTKVSGWHNGDLGITLGDGTAAALSAAPQGDDQPAEQAPQTATIPLIPRDDGTSGSDGEGSTWIDPATESAPDAAQSADSGASASDSPDIAASNAGAGAVDVTSLFARLASPGDVSDTLVTLDAMHSALGAWAGVAEAPDVAAAQRDVAAASVGLTSSDMTSALLDFQDAGQDLADHALLAPTPPSAAVSLELLQTAERTVGGRTSGTTGTGQRPSG